MPLVFPYEVPCGSPHLCSIVYQFFLLLPLNSKSFRESFLTARDFLLGHAMNSLFFSFRSLIGVEFFLFYGMKQDSNFTFFQMINQLSQHHLSKYPSCPVIYHILNLVYFCFLPYSTVCCLFVHQYHAALMTEALQYVFTQAKARPLYRFSGLPAIPACLFLHMNFYINLSNSIKINN